MSREELNFCKACGTEFASSLECFEHNCEARDPHADINPDDGLIANLEKITGGKS